MKSFINSSKALYEVSYSRSGKGCIDDVVSNLFDDILDRLGVHEDADEDDIRLPIWVEPGGFGCPFASDLARCELPRDRDRLQDIPKQFKAEPIVAVKTGRSLQNQNIGKHSPLLEGCDSASA